MNKPAERLYVDDGSIPLTQEERWIANILRSRLRAPLIWEYGADPIEVEAGDDRPFDYDPEFAIRNTETGRRLFLGFNNVPGLSLLSLMDLGLISAAARREGGDYLLFVEGELDPGIQRHLLTWQIPAVWLEDRDESKVMSAIEAALL